MRETGYAKINLALHVRGRKPDGYHRIETIFAFAEEGDVLHVGEGEALSLELEGPHARELGGEDNLVLRAARLLAQRCEPARGAALRLEKRLPVASGIGGGSADAAAALRLLNRWWKLGLSEADLSGLGRVLGADVPACVASRTAIGRGRGDELSPADRIAVAGKPVLLVNPGVAVSTAAVFGRWDGEDGGPLPADWRDGGNDLQRAAIIIVPEIGQALGALEAEHGTLCARMSGSGATCFAMFESEAARDDADRRLAVAHPGWWRLATRIR